MIPTRATRHLRTPTPAVLTALAVAAAALGCAVTMRMRLAAACAALAAARHDATHDPLTGLSNRAAVTALLASGTVTAVGLCDLTGLKAVNDRYGHDAGDELLRSAAARLECAMSGNGVAARLGGDEFALLWTEPVTDHHFHAVSDTLCQPVTIAGDIHTLRATIGVALAEPDLTGSALLSAADAAMYQARSGGRLVTVHQRNRPTMPSYRPVVRRRDTPVRPPRRHSDCDEIPWPTSGNGTADDGEVA